MDYKKEVSKIDQFLKTELYREAGRTCGELLESALRDIVSEVKAKAKYGEMLKIIESEKKIGGEGKSHIDLGLGKLVGLFREAKLFDMYEILCNKKLKYSKTIIHLQPLIDLRNTLTHNSNYTPSLDELEYFFSNVKTFLNELGLLSNDESISKPIEKIKAKIKCEYCSSEIEPEWEICPECSNPLKMFCDNCGKDLKATWKICPYCKTKVISDKEKSINQEKINYEQSKEETTSEMPTAVSNSQYRVLLQEAGDYKVDVIKIIRIYTGIGLREAHSLLSHLPSSIGTWESINKANKILNELRDNGAKAIVETIQLNKEEPKNNKKNKTINNKEGLESESVNFLYLVTLWVAGDASSNMHQIKRYTEYNLNEIKTFINNLPCLIGQFNEITKATHLVKELEKNGGKARIDKIRVKNLTSLVLDDKFYEIILLKVNDITKFINVIYHIRGIENSEAKGILNNIPCTILEGCDLYQAIRYKDRFERNGAQIELQKQYWM